MTDIEHLPHKERVAMCSLLYDGSQCSNHGLWPMQSAGYILGGLFFTERAELDSCCFAEKPLHFWRKGLFVTVCEYENDRYVSLDDVLQQVQTFLVTVL